ncbi:MAG: ferric reductase-like transmembrane domain-containing protein [Candidatus Daviesbacteria bacterium]|nr:ferric reductase-like transmembrane domain-containing protein [Candidatus Daviesbacteria bacterium]
MLELFSNIRFYILIFSLILSLSLYLLVTNGFLSATLTQTYALAAVTYLYIALLIGPLARVFKNLPLKAHFLKARRAVGVSAFYFASLHYFFAFTQTIGGLNSFLALDNQSRLAVGLGQISFLILLLLAVTSFDYMVERLTFNRWKTLHRLIYLVAFLIVIHALLLGTHFQNIGGLIPKIFLGALIILIFIQIISVYQTISNYKQTL